jgi:hypothetical protein
MSSLGNQNNGCPESAVAVERMLKEVGFDTGTPELDRWISASCALGFRPEDIAFHYSHMAGWAAMRERLSKTFPGFAGLGSERLGKLGLLFLRGASEEEMGEEVALVLAVIGAPASAPRFSCPARAAVFGRAARFPLLVDLHHFSAHCIRMDTRQNDTQGSSMKRAISAALLFLFLSAWAAVAAHASKPQPTPSQVQIVGTDKAPIQVQAVPEDEKQRAEEKTARDQEKAERRKDADDERKAREAENKKKSESDDALIFWTEILAVVGGIQIVIFFLQWRAFRATVAEMGKGTAATDNLAGITQKHVDATNSLAGQTKAQAEAANMLAAQAQAQAQASRDLAEASKVQAVAAVNAERAYLFCGFNADAVHTPTNEGSRRNFELSLTVENSGKTPAVIEKVRAYLVRASEPPATFDGAKAAVVKMPRGAGIAQAARATLNTQLTITHQNLQDLPISGGEYYAVASVEYYDVFRQELRTTNYCALCSRGRRGEEPIITPIFAQDAEVNVNT